MLNLALLFTVGAACLIPGASSTAYAQQAAGAITGTVTDQTGAPFANAVVTVRDIDRSTTWTAKTSSAGIYEFPQIPVGNVEITVEATGFATTKRNAFALVLNQVARVDFSLKVGNVSTTVEVVDAPPLLQTASTEMSTVLDAKAVTSLPAGDARHQPADPAGSGRRQSQHLRVPDGADDLWYRPSVRERRARAG